MTVTADRLQLQARLDSEKTRKERNQAGQFATPPSLAQAIVNETKQYFAADKSIRFLDPAFGTGAFYVAARQAFASQLTHAQGIEIDPHYGIPAQKLWAETPLELTIADFTQQTPTAAKPNLMICNPPYSRHHHLDSGYKQGLVAQVKQETRIKISGLSGLYAHFLLLADRWLSEDGIGCWLIPREFMDVNYGEAIKQYLRHHVQLLRIHCFNLDDGQFDDALVSSVVVWFRKRSSTDEQSVKLTAGSTLNAPDKVLERGRKTFAPSEKWSRYFNQHDLVTDVSPSCKLSDLFTIKRGIATGANKFFIMTAQKIEQRHLPKQFFLPILPSPRYVQQNAIATKENGDPIIDHRLYLLNCRLPEAVIQANYPHLWRYLEEGKQQQIDQRYICSHRSLWYAQETRLPAPIVCTYMGRSARPFRFIRNYSQAIAPNVYLMLYPKNQFKQSVEQVPKQLDQIWKWLNQLNNRHLTDEARVYGGGLFKIEPRELGNVRIALGQHLPHAPLKPIHQLALF